MKITVAGVGYVGLSLAVLLAQKHDVTAITTTESKAEKLNQFISPIQDEEIERFSFVSNCCRIAICPFKILSLAYKFSISLKSLTKL